MPDLESFYSLLLRFAFLSLFFIFIWGVFDTYALLKHTGKIKRGFKVWSEPLSESMQTFLESLTEDLIEERQSLFRKKVVGFIKVGDGEVLIQYRRKSWSTSWPYVGYVNLRKAQPVIEYRASLPMHLFLTPFMVSIVTILFVGILMVVNYLMERGAILDFIRKRMEQA